MSEPGTTETDPDSGRSHLLWGGALVLAAAATSVLVLSDDARLLRLGLIAALWGALLGAFAVARLRHRVSESEQAAADRQRIYELELEREIAARREFELEAEAEAQRRASENSDTQIRALQSELTKLRTTLEQVIGGDVLFERVALRAESTRVRSLPERAQGETKFLRPQQAKQVQQTKPAQLKPAQQAAAAQRTTTIPRPEPVQQQKTTVQQPVRPAKQEPVPAAAKTDVMAKLSGEVPLPEAPGPQAAQPKPAQPQAAQPQAAKPQAAKPQEPEQVPSAARRPDRTAYAKAAEPEPEGAHAAGTSVNDLIAAYGGAPDMQRRRRCRS
ncbi:DUF6779 domain-containing protein [Saccharopolyspora flava]|uniref:DUF6779 domain-containing protein n=1 Tax=Saccharopolyspora flava TaxID=95161 RepID=A0A1I6QY11_9PSEU|nr:DUF6779 domain-containing protein [Saccharopolyspora flava]SFS57138.1 hypothetical protein SAMN05660874_02050 [Saccharopolyspora flava]